MRQLLFLLQCLAAAGAISADMARAEPLTARRVVDLARRQSPAALIAATQIAEARGGLAQARLLSLDNPTIEATRGESDLGTAVDLELTVPLGFGARRSRQIAEANASLAREELLQTDAILRAVGEALRGFYETLHAERRVSIATERRDLARELVRVAQDRLRLGDAARLEVVAAEGELSRAESEILAEEHEAIRARMRLATSLGMTDVEQVQVAGDLSDRSIVDAAAGISPAQRADVLAAERDFEASKAAAAGARAKRLPDVAFRLNYEQDGDDDSIRPGVALTVPLFDRGQGAREQADARRDRAAVQLAARRSAASIEAQSARLAYGRMAASADEIEARALPLALELEELARQSYAAGKVDLTTLLVVQSGALETRREHADRLLQAALSGIELTIAVGTVPE